MKSIKFSSDILTECVRNTGEEWCLYKLVQWKNKVSFDIFNYISYHVKLLQLRYTAGNVNQSVIITEYWIYYSNYNIPLPLIK